MRAASLLVCRDAVGSQWQFGLLPPPFGRLVILGWTNPGASTDAGVPLDVARAVSIALTQVGMVTFPSSPAHLGSGINARQAEGVHHTLVRAPGHERLLWSRRKGPSADLLLASTRDAGAALQMFDDPLHPWWLQGQFALLCDADFDPASLRDSYEALALLLEPDWSAAFQQLVPLNVGCVVKPGVDGAVAGFLCGTEDSEAKLLAALEEACAATGQAWQELSEADFAREL